MKIFHRHPCLIPFHERFRSDGLGRFLFLCALRFSPACLRDAHVYACSNTTFQTYSAFMLHVVRMIFVFVRLFCVAVVGFIFQSLMYTANNRTLSLLSFSLARSKSSEKYQPTNQPTLAHRWDQRSQYISFIFSQLLNRVATWAMFFCCCFVWEAKIEIKEEIELVLVGKKTKHFLRPIDV